MAAPGTKGQDVRTGVRPNKATDKRSDAAIKRSERKVASAKKYKVPKKGAKA